MKKFLMIAAIVAPFLGNLAFADETAPANGDKPAKKSTKSSKSSKSKKSTDKAAAPANP